jgi:hypothetical protein
MSKLLNQLRHLIREEILAADANDVLGMWAFADQRKNIVPKEKNNKIEKMLLLNLAAHFNGERLLSKGDCQIIESILEKEIYKDMFHEPLVEKVYRGINISSSTFSKMGFAKLYADATQNEWVHFDDGQDRILPPMRGHYASSWTSSNLGEPESSSNVAWTYATGGNAYGDGEQVGLVFEAHLSKNRYKFFDAKSFYDLKGMNETASENEVIGLNSIRYSGFWMIKLY